MPITSSAKKALKVSIRRTKENRQIKQNIREALKKADAKSEPEVYSVLDKAAKKNVIHPNKAARLKSRFSLKVAKGSLAIEKKVAKSVKAKKITAKKTLAKAKTKRTKK